MLWCWSPGNHGPSSCSGDGAGRRAAERTPGRSEIRALEFAKALGPDFDVTLVAKRRDPTTREGIRVLPARRSVILAEATRTDVVISPSLPPYLLAVKPMLGFAAVADQYDPHELELATLDGSQRTRELRRRFAFRTLQLRQADLVLCAGVRQRQALINAALDQTVRGRPLQIDPVVIPFGISQAPPPTGRRPLREHFPAIGEDDKVVIWWGTVWRWFDAETAIRAFAEISGQRSDVKLVITAGKPPNKNASRFEATKGAMALARELGVADRAVFFLDEWIPYESRYDYLREAELGLTLHRSEQGAELAARARYMDYLSVGLPCVLGRGDEVADDFERASYATLVDRPTPQALASHVIGPARQPRGPRSTQGGRHPVGESATVERRRAAAAIRPRVDPRGPELRRPHDVGKSCEDNVLLRAKGGRPGRRGDRLSPVSRAPRLGRLSPVSRDGSARLSQARRNGAADRPTVTDSARRSAATRVEVVPVSAPRAPSAATHTR